MYDRIVDVPRLLGFYDEDEPLPDPSLETARDGAQRPVRRRARRAVPHRRACATTATAATASPGTATRSAGAAPRTRWSPSSRSATRAPCCCAPRGGRPGAAPRAGPRRPARDGRQLPAHLGARHPEDGPPGRPADQHPVPPARRALTCASARLEQGADRLSIVDAADGLGERGRDRQHGQLPVPAAPAAAERCWCRRSPVRRPGGQPLERVAAEQAVGAGDPDRPGAPLPAGGRAARSTVLPLAISSSSTMTSRSATSPMTALIRTTSSLKRCLAPTASGHAQQAGERGRLLGVAQVGRHDDASGRDRRPRKCVASSRSALQVVDRDAEEAVHLRGVQGHRRAPGSRRRSGAGRRRAARRWRCAGASFLSERAYA